MSSFRCARSGVLVFLVGSPAHHEDKPLDVAVLKKVKAATVSIRVKLQDGRTTSGSGFLTDEPGLVLTNAHVLNMLDPESRKPVKVEVTVHSGTDQSKTLAGTVVGVDRNGDLGLVRIDAKGLPAPLVLGTAENLNETENVYCFGFPFGDELGKEITVAKASVSSLRRNAAGTLHRVQLQGGLNPGNSGGPVVDTKGNVVGVAVSGVRGSQIGFAIPADHVGPFINGRIVESGVGQAYKDGDTLFLPITLVFVDPLSRLKKVELEVWVAKPGPGRPGGPKEPAAMPGDTPKARHTMKYDGTSVAKLDVPVPAASARTGVLVPTGHHQRHRLNELGDGDPRAAVVPAGTRAAVLEYKPAAERKQTAEISSQGGFRLRNEDGEEHSISVDFRTAYTEAFGPPARKAFPVRLTYDQFFLTLKANGKPLPGDENIRKWLARARFAAAELEMDSDGGLGTAKADLAGVPQESRGMWEDLSTQVLSSVEVLSIPLPGKKVSATDTWKARRNLVIGSAVIAVGATGGSGVRVHGRPDDRRQGVRHDRNWRNDPRPARSGCGRGRVGGRDRAVVDGNR